MGTGSVACGRRDTLHSGQPSETHGLTKPRKNHSKHPREENVWMLTNVATGGGSTHTTHHNNCTRAQRGGEDYRAVGYSCRDVGGDRTTHERETRGEGHRCQTQPREKGV